MSQVKVWDLSEAYSAIWVKGSLGHSVWSWETTDHEVGHINLDNTAFCSMCEQDVALEDFEQWKIDEWYEVLADE